MRLSGGRHPCGRLACFRTDAPQACAGRADPADLVFVGSDLLLRHLFHESLLGANRRMPAAVAAATSRAVEAARQAAAGLADERTLHVIFGVGFADCHRNPPADRYQSASLRRTVCLPCGWLSSRLMGSGRDGFCRRQAPGQRGESNRHDGQEASQPKLPQRGVWESHGKRLRADVILKNRKTAECQSR